MHGIIHSELKRFVETQMGVETYQTILNKAGLVGKVYTAVATYPDEDALAIVKTASLMTGQPTKLLLEKFGEFIAPTLLGMYKHLIKPEWRTKELLLNIEDTIHSVVRIKNPGAAPPKLAFSQSGSDTLVLHYNSPRQLQSVAKGIMIGVARHFNEKIEFDAKKTAAGYEVQIHIW